MVMMNRDMRRIASNAVSLDGIRLGRYVVELSGQLVMAYYPLTCELAFTEWTAEPIDLFTDNAGCIRINQ